MNFIIIIIILANLSDRKFLQVSRTLLSILADLINAVIWMISIRLFFDSYNLFSYQLQLVSQSLSCSAVFLVL